MLFAVASLLPPVYAHSPMVVHGYTRSAREYFPQKFLAARYIPLAGYIEICHTPVLQKMY